MDFAAVASAKLTPIAGVTASVAPARTAGSGSAGSGTVQDSVEISQEGQAASQSAEQVQDPEKQDGTQEKATQAAGTNSQDLSKEQKDEVDKLKARDTAVKAHEAAHLAAAGGLAQGGPSFTYQQGPDGAKYAIGGEVSIDTSPVKGDPEATMAKAQRIIAAALAPADPSPQDRTVAAMATAMEMQAASELAKSKGGQPSQVGSQLDISA
nr:putative metalloprotease CJM1_0395 family protein [uncultured Holophaga sp.]